MEINKDKILLSIDCDEDINSSGVCVVPFGVKEIAPNVFSRSEIKEIILPNTITIIGKNAFYNCDIESIDIPDSVRIIEEDCFYGCHHLETVIKYPPNMDYIPVRAFYECDKLESFIIPEGVKEIGASAFEDCTCLQNLSIPNGVTVIGANAFNNTAITSLRIPESVEKIGDDTFNWCHDLKEIYTYKPHLLTNDVLGCHCGDVKIIDLGKEKSKPLEISSKEPDRVYEEWPKSFGGWESFPYHHKDALKNVLNDFKNMWNDSH
jgi:RPA family protein